MFEGLKLSLKVTLCLLLLLLELVEFGEQLRSLLLAVPQVLLQLFDLVFRLLLVSILLVQHLGELSVKAFSLSFQLLDTISLFG